jgi:hypothetical protein
MGIAHWAVELVELLRRHHHDTRLADRAAQSRRGCGQQEIRPIVDARSAAMAAAALARLRTAVDKQFWNITPSQNATAMPFNGPCHVNAA